MVKMTLREIGEILKAEIVCGDEWLDEDISFAGGSDMMSDVLAFSQPGILLLTGLTNTHAVRTADIIEAKGIVYVRGKKPTAEGIELARRKKIPILSTKLMMYTACGLLYSHNIAGVDENKTS